MTFATFAALAMLWTTAAQSAPQTDPVAALVQQLEAAAKAGNREAIRSLGVDLTVTSDLAFALTSPPPSEIVIRERDRTEIKEGQRLLLEVFWQRGGEGRLGTWTIDVSKVDNGWRIAAATRLAQVAGLYRLALNGAKQFDVHNLSVEGPDLTLKMASGSAFVAETPEGITAVVLVGRGIMRFSPPEAAERIQVRIFSGADVLETPFDAAFVRVRPEDFATQFSKEALIERPSVQRDVDRARDVFEDYVGRTLQINLSDLSPDRWSITPQPGDMIAEIRTSEFGTLTYTRARSDPEDITLFDRRKRRNISVYASAEKLASRGRFYNEDDLVDYDILAYELDATILPDREIVQGTARLKLKVRAAATTTISLRLAEQLAVAGVYSPDYGRLLHLRVVNQNSLIVNLPSAIVNGAEFWLAIQYGGRLPPQELDREAIAVAQELPDPVVLPAERRFVYSNRSYWYPQSVVSDYGSVRMKITVPAEFDVIGTGLAVGEPTPPPGVADGPRRLTFLFESERPVRYLACVISRLRDVESRELTTGPKPEDRVAMRVLANPRQVGRARSMADRAAEIYAYYGKVVGDTPYPGFTLGLTERDLPGGHSPAYFAVVDQPVQASLTWRNDPVNFDNYPSFFVAHEIAHQWWGQAVGWKNYHEQWLSEGFAQYFAALYAENQLAPGVINNVLRQMRRTAMNESPEGPVYLGYRLGHIKGESRVFRSVIYNKAAMVLHMLRRLIGDEAFFKGVRTFFAEWKYRKAGTDDLIAVMEKASGRDLSEFFDGWIFGATLPEVRFSYRIEGNRLFMRLEQTSLPIEFPVTVKLTYRSGQVHNVVMVARGKVSEMTVDLLDQLRQIDVNDDNGALVNVR